HFGRHAVIRNTRFDQWFTGRIKRIYLLWRETFYRSKARPKFCPGSRQRCPVAFRHCYRRLHSGLRLVDNKDVVLKILLRGIVIYVALSCFAKSALYGVQSVSTKGPCRKDFATLRTAGTGPMRFGFCVCIRRPLIRRFVASVSLQFFP